MKHFLFLALILVAPVRAENLSRHELEVLARELAPKVDLFQEVWQTDPTAEFYGGTSRDFLYWIKSRFRGVRGEKEKEKKMLELRSLPGIEVKEFIVRESDVDVISSHTFRINPDKYGVKRVDAISREILDPNSERGRNERLQGFIPVEKIRLSKNGLDTHRDFGDGVSEILSGKLTVKFAVPGDFERSYYARLGRNHPTFLALRYIRLLSTHYYYENGQGYPDMKKLLNIDPTIADEVRGIIAAGAQDPKLFSLMRDDWFRGKMNGAIHKAFRSYTNPSAALELYRYFGADKLVAAHEGLQPINQYLFAAPPRNENEITANIAKLKVDSGKLFIPTQQVFRDQYLYHGSGNETAFESIMMTGVLPSETQNVIFGRGLYAVASENVNFAKDWKNSGDRVVKFKIDPNARIVDVTTGEGERAFSMYRQISGNNDPDKFAEFIGADIIKYPYTTDAFVVKNSGILDRPEPVFRQVIRSYPKLVEVASHVNDEASFAALVNAAALAPLPAETINQVIEFAFGNMNPNGDEGRIIRFWRALRKTPGRNHMRSMQLLRELFDHLDAWSASPNDGRKQNALHNAWQDFRDHYTEMFQKHGGATSELHEAILSGVNPRYARQQVEKLRERIETYPLLMKQLPKHVPNVLMTKDEMDAVNIIEGRKHSRFIHGIGGVAVSTVIAGLVAYAMKDFSYIGYGPIFGPLAGVHFHLDHMRKQYYFRNRLSWDEAEKFRQLSDELAERARELGEPIPGRGVFARGLLKIGNGIERASRACSYVIDKIASLQR